MTHSLALRQTEFDALLASLASSREQAGEQYESIRNKLLRYFEFHRCVPADEYADETIDRVARRLASGEQIRSPNPYRYFLGVAKNVFLEGRKRQARVPEHYAPETIVEHAPPPPLTCLRCCMSALTPDGRELLEAYYLDARSELAAREGVTPNALRLRVFREKQKLRTCLARCIGHQD
jgi:DNA-directed RNA polymerase specialized sigma24 family protein